ncbi:MAG TPA: hypothetical protein VKF62_03205 [Planctomycetota bacterium]|nr:hypothetical protein [Planctomycetota bacterium]
MDRGPSDVAIRAGRITRGVLATLVLGANCLGALFMLLFVCCSSPPLARRIGHPLFWAFVCAALTALCAFPPISKRLRRTAARWVCAPFVAGTVLFPVLAAPDLREVFAQRSAWGVIASTGICALYVLFRILLFPRGMGGVPEGGEAGRTP